MFCLATTRRVEYPGSESEGVYRERPNRSDLVSSIWFNEERKLVRFHLFAIRADSLVASLQHQSLLCRLFGGSPLLLGGTDPRAPQASQLAKWEAQKSCSEFPFSPSFWQEFRSLFIATQLGKFVRQDSYLFRIEAAPELLSARAGLCITSWKDGVGLGRDEKYECANAWEQKPSTKQWENVNNTMFEPESQWFD